MKYSFIYRHKHAPLHFLSCTRATAIIEFAVTLPVLMFLYLGCVQICDMASTYRRITTTTTQIVNMASRERTVDNTKLSSFVGAAPMLMAPHPGSPLKLTLSQISVGADGSATVDWSYSTSGSTALVVGSVYDLPVSLKIPNTSVVIGHSTYNYRSLFPNLFTPSLSLKDTIYMYPRIVTKINKV